MAPQSRTSQDPASTFLRFLDYFCILFALVLINSGIYGTNTAPVWITVVITIAFMISWFVWRRWPSASTAALVGIVGVMVLVVANNPISVAALWLSIVALSQSLPRSIALALCSIPVATTIGLHLVVGSPFSKIAIEVGAMLIAVAAGVALADSINTSIDNTKQLKAALRDSQELALSRERERIAASLHDGLGHRLTSIGLSLDYSARMIDRDPAKARSEIDSARQATSDALDSMRTTVRAMKPISLNDEALSPTLRRFATSFDNTDLDVSVEGEPESSLSDDTAQLILHFVQEALTNVVRHARADRVIIRVAEDEVAVSDNGMGNDHQAGFGLDSMREKAHSLGARIDTAPHGGIDGGFRLTLKLPKERA